MAFRNSLLLPARRFAAGIDVGSLSLRLVVLSSRSRRDGVVRLEHVAIAPLTAGAMAGAEIVDRAAVARALRDLFSGLPSVCTAATLRCAMGLPASATLMATMPLAQLGAGAVRSVRRHALGELEPAVLVEAERIAGIERHALAVDWFIDDASPEPDRVTIAAAGRMHLEARVECAASAGITLTALDSEPFAALRALRYAAGRELGANEPYLAIWIGAEGVHGWRIAGDAIDGEIRYPAPEYDDFADALRDLAADHASGSVLIGGEVDLLDGIGFSTADVGDVLGCTTLPFECATFGEGAHPFAPEFLHEPACTVAFGLALRGVFE
ncbi:MULTISPECIES: pilus assembly protein PilM [Paraburkholderia]|uniref:pilus assembly protein PilM n=1 Tax=Paraburkholderia TaxID=1822464 RepID=UPI00225674A3|nr:MULTISPECIES: pilus assembly protein PilM [Paraburkholderia]MCX4165752.1 pilus assembly protein PilM [Paraburkholderia megapolitana]MDN7161243.1 pilus assembly protein PilM [Paraburkholderia sp. CHISQ3]MDQ6498290.1 pilus assembly protein PilM [Paraburkholderia megapolitana]